MNKKCLVIPTNRECCNCIKAYVSECSDIQKRTGDECIFILIDTSEKCIQNMHRTLIDSLRNEYKDVKVIYLNNDAQSNFLKTLVSKYDSSNPELLYDLLNPSGLSYGAAANKTFLVASMLGCNVMFRRDSDTLPQVKEGAYLFPSVIEDRYLGKKLGEVSGKLDKNDYANRMNVVQENPILMVGANYLGEWAGDYREMYEYDAQILHKHVWMNMPHKSSKEVNERIEYRYLQRNSDLHTEDKIQVVKDDLIEVGNFALKDVFLDIPLLPSEYALSMDYFYHSLFDEILLPKLYHNRHVQHFHTAERGSQAWFNRYHLGIAKSKVLRRYLALVFQQIARERQIVYVDERINNLEISNICMEVSKERLAETSILMEDLIELYNSIGIEKYPIVASLMKEKKDEILEDAQRDIGKFAFLSKEWKSLCECATKCENQF